MKRQLNKNEFMRCKRGLDGAMEMYESAHYKEAWLELKPVLKILERDYEMNRMLAKSWLLAGKIHAALHKNKKALEYFEAAATACASIEDSSDLILEIEEQKHQIFE